MCGGYTTLEDALADYRLPRYAPYFDITEHTVNGKLYVEVFDKADQSTEIMHEDGGRVRSSSWLWDADEVNEYKQSVGIPITSTLPQVTEQAV